jgi:hypothetical protein
MIQYCTPIFSSNINYTAVHDEYVYFTEQAILLFVALFQRFHLLVEDSIHVFQGRAILKVDVLIVLIVLIVLSSESFNDIFEANTFIGLGAVYIRYLLPATECAKVLQRGEEEARYRNGND